MDALEFYARHELQIEPSYNKGINILAHRYIFTPMTHDTVRGTKKEFLDYLYGKKVIEPDIVFFLDVKPELAYKRIIMYRKPSFFECGLDIEYSKHISIGLKRYAENYFSDNELKERFLDFQHQIYLNYKEVLPSYATVFVNGVNSISEQKNLIVQKLQDSFKGLQN